MDVKKFKIGGKHVVIVDGRLYEEVAEEEKVYKTTSKETKKVTTKPAVADRGTNKRAPLLVGDQRDEFARLAQEGMSVEDLAAKFGLTRTQVYSLRNNLLKKLKPTQSQPDENFATQPATNHTAGDFEFPDDEV